MENKEFTPRQIGRSNDKQRNEIATAYENLIDCACGLQLAIGASLEDPTDHDVKFLLDAVSEDTTKFIKQVFVRVNEIRIPGISTDKLMELDLLSIPELDEVVKARKKFDQALQRVKDTKFFYPLHKLYTGHQTGWDLTPEFFEELDKFVRNFTTTEAQNEILQTIEKLVDALNDLSKRGILRPKYGSNELTNLFPLLTIDLSTVESYSVNREVFTRPRLTNYRNVKNGPVKRYGPEIILK
jgi:hypothetical protein